MADTRSTIQKMEDTFALITIEDEEKGGLQYGEQDEMQAEIDMRWCLVGRFLAESPIDFQAMQHKMAAL